MKKKILNIAVYLVFVGLGVWLGRFDLGIEVFPVFGEARRVGLTLTLVPLLGIAYGPLYGTLGALAAGWGAQTLYAATAFAGPWTFLIAPLCALSCGFIKKRNWIPSLLLVGGAALMWRQVVPAELDTGAIFPVFALSAAAFVLAAGVYGTEFTVEENYFIRVVGNLMIVLAGMNTAVFAAAGLSTTAYELPAFMWANMNIYTFLSISYLTSFLALLPVIVVTILLPRLGVVLGMQYYWKDHRRRRHVVH